MIVLPRPHSNRRLHGSALVAGDLSEQVRVEGGKLKLPWAAMKPGQTFEVATPDGWTHTRLAEALRKLAAARRDRLRHEYVVEERGCGCTVRRVA